MMRERLAHYGIYARALGKWVLVSLMIGGMAGLAGSAFHLGVDAATRFRTEHGWSVFLLPLFGLVIVGLYRLLRVEDWGTNNVIREVQSGEGLSLKLFPAIFLSTILTHLGGGSVGREGAALQMGGSLGYTIGTRLHLDDRDIRTATMAGMAAFFAALFGTPLAATVFAMGVISVGLLYHAAMIPCLISSLTAYGISLLLGVEPARFAVQAPAHGLLMFLRVTILAVLCAFASILFCHCLHRCESFFHKKIKNAWLRILIGGCVLAVLGILPIAGRYQGAGMDVIRQAVENGAAMPGDFLLKILFTSIALGVGYKGGEVVPLFFVGSTFGCVVGPLLGIPAGFAAAIGLIAVFCAAVNCPLASIFLSVELFGAGGMLYFALACGLAYVLSGYSGIYSSQRILYDKLKAQYIDVRTNAHHEGISTEAERRFR